MKAEQNNLTKYISILRGINVSGHNVLKMDTLKKMLTELKFEHVQTYIQSGNIIFEAAKDTTDIISKSIQTKIEKEFGFHVPVITLTQDELEIVIGANPFLNDNSKDPSFFHITFLSEKPNKADVEQLIQLNLNNDSFILIDKAIYLFCPNGYGKTKLTNSFIENKLKVIATTRNWKTANELLKMARN